MFIFLVTMNDSFLTGLNFTNHFPAQTEILFMSSLISRAAVSGFSTITKRLVSSAKRRIFEPISLTISLM